MNSKNIDWKLVSVFVCLVVFAIIYMLNQESIMQGIQAVLEWPHLNATLWLSVLVSFFIHYLSMKNNHGTYDGLIYKAFGMFADSAFAAITYGLALTTSASILKGVYVQQFIGGMIYFANFDEIDICSMLVVCLFLFGYSAYSTGTALIAAIYRGAGENAEPAKQSV